MDLKTVLIFSSSIFRLLGLWDFEFTSKGHKTVIQQVIKKNIKLKHVTLLLKIALQKGYVVF